MNLFLLLIPVAVCMLLAAVCVALGRLIAREADRYPTPAERRLLREIDRHNETEPG